LADKKITQLTNITGANLADADEFVVVDITADETKAITFSELKTAFDTGTGFVRVTGDTMTGALNVESTITADGLTVDGTANGSGVTAGLVSGQNVEVGLDRWTGSGSNFHQWQLYTDVDDLQIRNVYNNTKGTAFTPRVNYSSNGDISFYEDTGTTAKFFWDSSAESLGIGTSSPSAPLSFGDNLPSNGQTIHTYHSGNIRSGLGIVSGVHRLFTDSGSSLSFGQVSTSDGSTYEERMRIDSSGNVGIGTSSPSAKLHIEAATTNEAIRINTNTGYNAGINYYVNNVIKWTAQALGDGSDAYRFYHFGTNSEAMRIDSSGNVLVGKTSANPTIAGVAIEADGDAYFTAEGANGRVLYANRLSSDGDIMQFAKDGTTVGSIASNNGNRLAIGSLDTGLLFVQDADDIIPFNMSTGAGRDNAIDLGQSGNRFKDLYLSGGVYLGGTGSANKLDDYEEGTWTPNPTFGTQATGMTFSTLAGGYTKVGRVVYVSGRIVFSNKGSSTGVFQIYGLPFTASNLGEGFYGGGFLVYAGNLANPTSWEVTQYPVIDTNNSYIYMRYANSSGGSSNHSNSDINNNTDLLFQAFYTTDA
jgi:hypothetical protein